MNSTWELLGAGLVFLIGLAVCLSQRRRFGFTLGRGLVIYGWHTLFCLAYYFVSFGEVSDSAGYYLAARAGDIEFSVGGAAVKYLTFILVDWFQLSFLGCFMAYNIIGAVGLLAFDACLRHATEGKPRRIRWLATLLVFLPSVSFWSCAIGKDALAFLAVGLALWGSIDAGRRFPTLVGAVALMLLVRPHVAGLMATALTLGFMFQQRAPLSRKIVLGLVGLLAAAVLIPFALNYAGLAATDIESVTSYVEKRQGVLQGTAGAIDLSSMSLPAQLFTYLFRPLPYEASSLMALAASVDNVVLLMLLLAGVFLLFREYQSGPGEIRLFLWVYPLLMWVVLAPTTANLGIAVRQKWMFLPVLLYLLLSLMGKPAIKRGEPALAESSR